MLVPAEATPQPGQRFLTLPSASSPLGRLRTEHDGNDNDDNVQSTKPVIIELNLFHLGRGALVD